MLIKLMFFTNIYILIMYLFMKTPMQMCFNMFIQSINLMLLVNYYKEYSIMMIMMMMIYSSNMLIMYMYMCMIIFNNKFTIKFNMINLIMLMMMNTNYKMNLYKNLMFMNLMFTKMFKIYYIMKIFIIIMIMLIMIIITNFLFNKNFGPMKKYFNN